jgi:hypothetical protein
MKEEKPNLIMNEEGRVDNLEPGFNKVNLDNFINPDTVGPDDHKLNAVIDELRKKYPNLSSIPKEEIESFLLDIIKQFKNNPTS